MLFNPTAENPYPIVDKQKIALVIQQKNWPELWLYIDKILFLFAEINRKARLPLAEDLKGTGENKDKAKFFLKTYVETLLTAILHKDIDIPDEAFNQVITRHETLHRLLALAGVSNTDEMVQGILGEGGKKLTPLQQKKLLLILAPTTKLPMIEIIKKTLIKYRARAVYSYLLHPTMYNSAIYANKNALIEVSDIIDTLPCEERLLQDVQNLYFRVSYLDAPHKHRVKKTLNNYIKRFFRERNLLNAPFTPREYPDNTDGKPVLVIFSEIFHSNHAMFRSHSQRIASYREKFYVILVTLGGQNIDPAVFDMCDEFVEIKANEVIQSISLFKSFGADVIYFLSVGMTILSVLLSNFRFAPLQIMALGHPATSYSREIDFVTGKEDHYTKRAFPYDRFVAEYSAIGHKPQLQYTKDTLPLPKDTEAGNELHIAIPGIALKLSAPFFDLVEEMVRELKENKPDAQIHIKVMSSDKHTREILMADYLTHKFSPYGEFTYLGFQEYNLYFEQLRGSDIVLCPFPFGHSHTMSDALLAGKPVISLKGDEPHSRTEYAFLKFFGLDGQFSADNLDEYRAKFKELTDNILNGKRKFFDPLHVYDTLFNEEKPYNYCDLVWWLYENHERLKKSKEKFIIPDFYGEA